MALLLSIGIACLIVTLTNKRLEKAGKPKLKGLGLFLFWWVAYFLIFTVIWLIARYVFNMPFVR